MESLYVLKLEDDKWYVGKSADVAKRFEQHVQGKGAAWTKTYKPIRIVETRRITSIHDETNTTKDYMKKYGIDNVRGGAYTQIDLSDDISDMIKAELRGNNDACYKCGTKGHFANKCSKKEEVYECAFCEDEFSTEAACLKHEKRCGGQVEQPATKRSYGTCYRCGRAGHWTPDCYAQTHKNGYDL